MSVAEFDAGYHYAVEVKSFARSLGIAVGNFRKHEVEELIRKYLSTGRIPTRKPVLPRTSSGPRDTLNPDAIVSNYVDDRMTKDFLRRVVHMEDPGLRDKSGQWYWLNDWRREQQETGARFTYRDLTWSINVSVLLRHDYGGTFGRHLTQSSTYRQTTRRNGDGDE